MPAKFGSFLTQRAKQLDSASIHNTLRRANAGLIGRSSRGVTNPAIPVRTADGEVRLHPPGEFMGKRDHDSVVVGVWPADRKPEQLLPALYRSHTLVEKVRDLLPRRKRALRMESC